MKYNINLNNENWLILCKYKSNKNGFSHLVYIYENDLLIGTGRCNYINRTWEMYDYQTTIIKALNNAINNYWLGYIDTFKQDTKIQRLSKNKKELLQQTFELQDYIMTIKKLIELAKNGGLKNVKC